MQISYGSKSERPGLVGRLFMIIFLLPFGLFGAYFFWMMLSDFLVTIDTQRWSAERCEVIESRIQTTPSDKSSFEPFVRYRYSIHGLPQTSTSISKGSQKVSDIGDAQRFIDRFPIGTKVPCFVNPNNAADSILVHDSLLRGFALLFPLVFILIGFGGAYLVLNARSSESDIKQKPKTISKATGSTVGGRAIIIGFFGIFFLFGLVFMILMGASIWRGFQSSNWPKHSCKVISSDVSRDDSGDGGPTFSVNVLYEYQAGGRTLQSNTYSSFKVSSGSYTENKRVADTFKPGSFVDCYVDPADPTYAVLVRGVGWNALMLLIPGIFLAVGLGGIIFALRSDLSASKSQHREKARIPARRSTHTGPIELKPGSSPTGRFAGLLFVSLFWNGIVSVFVWQAFESYRRGSAEVFLSLFLIPFVLIGLALLAGVVHAFLGLFLPRPKLTISQDVIPLGGSATLTWEVSGNTARIRSLAFRLIGYEEVRYTRGTSTYTDKREFYRDEFLNIPLHGQRQGSASFTVPADTMHTFRATDNKILWKITLEGDIPLSPNLKEEYEIEICPAPRRER